MAELIRLQLESTLPAMEYFEARGVFTRKEISAIVRKREEHEYTLKAQMKHVEPYLQAVQYELGLEKLRARRMKGLGTRGETPAERELRQSIVKRISFLFVRGLWYVRGSAQVQQLFDKYVEFLKNTGRLSSIAKLNGKMIQLHPMCEHFWLHAAEFEGETQGNPAAARLLLQQGLRLLPDCSALHLRHFQLELRFAHGMATKLLATPAEDPGAQQAEASQKKRASMTELACGRLPLVVYRNAVSRPALGDRPELHMEFLSEAARLPFTSEIQNAICVAALQRFPRHPGVVVRALARVLYYAEAGTASAARALQD
eukprot:RCo042085